MEKIIKVGILIVEKEKVLLIKEWSETKMDYYWNIIKGTYEEVFDKRISDCAIREVKEEINATVSLKDFLGVYIKFGYDLRTYFCFTASIIDGKPQIASKKEQLERKEDIKDFQWLTKKELEKIKKEDFINDIAYSTVQKWISSKVYSLDLVNEIVLDH